MYHSYEPDGQTTMRFRSYVKNPYRYNAERVDYIPGIADFQYLRARYYTPDTARFTQQDTVWGKIDVPLSQNLYAYCGNNPLNFVDPSGHYVSGSIEKAKEAIVRVSCETGVYSYKDDKGNVFDREWLITNKMFLDKDSMTLSEITSLMKSKNPGLVKRGFDKEMYRFTQIKGVNPKILLATLQWEQSWCKDSNGDGIDNDADYISAFGVGVAGKPKIYDPEDYGGMEDAFDTYLKWFNKGIEMELNGDFEAGMIVNQDKYFKDSGGGGSSKDYVDKNPNMADYMIAGQKIVPVNAAMYARLKFNSWLYYPADEGNKGSHSTKKWHDTVISGLRG